MKTLKCLLVMTMAVSLFACGYDNGNTTNEAEDPMGTSAEKLRVVVPKGDPSIRVSLARFYIGSTQMTVGVDDEQLRKVIPKGEHFDGLEKVFALVPDREGAHPKWYRVELAYQGKPVGTHDLHGAIVENSYGPIWENGVAFGLDTNVGTVWLQLPGDNYRF